MNLSNVGFILLMYNSLQNVQNKIGTLQEYEHHIWNEKW